MSVSSSVGRVILTLMDTLRLNSLAMRLISMHLGSVLSSFFSNWYFSLIFYFIRVSLSSIFFFPLFISLFSRSASLRSCSIFFSYSTLDTCCSRFFRLSSLSFRFCMSFASSSSLTLMAASFSSLSRFSTSLIISFSISSFFRYNSFWANYQSIFFSST